jgi:hypothetical protein
MSEISLLPTCHDYHLWMPFIPTLPVHHFCAFYQDHANGSYGGEYELVMTLFNEEERVLEATIMFDHVKASNKKMGISVGMFEDTIHDLGRSLCIHDIHPFHTEMDQPSEWDKYTFGFVNDVSGHIIQSIEVVKSMVYRTRRVISTRVHSTVANSNQYWASIPALEVLISSPMRNLDPYFPSPTI